MSVLKNSKNHLTIIGIRFVPIQNLPAFLQGLQLTINRIQILCVIFLFGTYTFGVFCTLIFKANGFSELSKALTYYVIGIVHSSFYCISIWKRPKIMAFMDDLEETIKKSLFQRISKFSKFYGKIFAFLIRKCKSSNSCHLHAIEWNGRYNFEFHLEINFRIWLFFYHFSCICFVLQLFYSWWNGSGISIAHSFDVSDFLIYN